MTADRPRVRARLRTIAATGLTLCLIVGLISGMWATVGVPPLLIAVLIATGLAIPGLTLAYIAVAAGGKERKALWIGGATFAVQAIVALVFLIPPTRYLGLVLAVPGAVITVVGLSAMVVAVLPRVPGDRRG